MENQQAELVEFVVSLENMTKEELIQQVATRKLENQILKKQLKFTDSYIIETPKTETKVPVSPKTGVQRIVNHNIINAQKPNNIIVSPYVQVNQNSGQKKIVQIIKKQNNQINTGKKVRLGASHVCPKKHNLHFQKQHPQFTCSRCQHKSKKFSWSCLSCNHHQCISCKTYPRYHCPYNDVLHPSGSLNIDLSKRMCDICQDQIQLNSLTCPSCNYDLCQKCAKN